MGSKGKAGRSQKHYTPEERREAIEAFGKSGLTKRVFAATCQAFILAAIVSRRCQAETPARVRMIRRAYWNTPSILSRTSAPRSLMLTRRASHSA